MNGIAIHDMIGRGLAFDLAEILEAIGVRATSAEWRVRRDLFSYVADRDVAEFEQPLERWISGSAFVRAAGEIRQVIDGVFEARHTPEEPVPWVTVRAVDSSWWEVYTDDIAVLDSIGRRFVDVRPATYDATTTY